MSCSNNEVNSSIWMLVFLGIILLVGVACLTIFCHQDNQQHATTASQEDATWKLERFDESIVRLNTQLFRAQYGKAQSLDVLNRSDESLLALHQACLSFRESDRSDQVYQKEADTLWRKLYSQKAENARQVKAGFGQIPGDPGAVLAAANEQSYLRLAEQGFCPDGWQPGE